MLHLRSFTRQPSSIISFYLRSPLSVTNNNNNNNCNVSHFSLSVSLTNTMTSLPQVFPAPFAFVCILIALQNVKLPQFYSKCHLPLCIVRLHGHYYLILWSQVFPPSPGISIYINPFAKSLATSFPHTKKKSSLSQPFLPHLIALSIPYTIFLFYFYPSLCKISGLFRSLTNIIYSSASLTFTIIIMPQPL